MNWAFPGLATLAQARDLVTAEMCGLNASLLQTEAEILLFASLSSKQAE